MVGLFEIFQTFFSEFFLRIDTHVFRTLSNPVLCESSLNVVNHFRKTFAKYFTLDVLLCSEYSYDRSSHRTCYVRKGVLRNFPKFTGKHMCQSPFFNRLAGTRSGSLLKKWLWQRCFAVDFAKFLRIPYLQITSGRLLLLWLSRRSV